MVKIRLRRVGAKKQASFRVVVADSRAPRDGRFIEQIGFYNPRTEPETLRIDEARALHWLNVGAQPTDSAARLLSTTGTMDRFERLKQGESLDTLVAEAEEAEVAEAEEEGVDIRFYNVIYQLVNDVKEAMAGMLAPVTREVYLGQAEVRDTFNVPKFGTIAGCFILDGKLKRNAMVRLLREGVVITTSRLNSLKRFKDDVKEVSKDYECGASLENYNDIKIGDIIEAFEEVQEKATLE